MNNLPNNRIYYAQNREDLILESFFEDVSEGLYIDIGACHPHVASVTKRFYLRGWRGINIEPQINLFQLFEADRSRDINLNIGASDKKGTLSLRSYINNQGLSTATDEIKSKYQKEQNEDYEDIEIKVDTLESILRYHKVKSIQFMKIDVEGHEYEVLKGNNWSKFRPEIICIEADHIVKDWRPILIKNSYKKVFSDGLNEYFADSKTNRGTKFNFIKHVVLDLKGGISADDYTRIEELENVNTEQARLIQKFKSKTHKPDNNSTYRTYISKAQKYLSKWKRFK